jgi:hypothetical protein
MELQGSLPWSQKPITGPYPGPNESSQYNPTSLRSILIPSILSPGLRSGIFLYGVFTLVLY